jgi:outer membrane immunogenic protein
MKRILFGVGVAAIASTLGTSALAADLPLKAPPLPVAVYNWTGFYVGGNLGYSWGRSSTTTSFFDATSGALLSADARRFNMDGGIGGVQAGYNWQRDKWLFGVEADIQASGQRGDGLFACGGGALTPRAALNSACVPGHVGDTTAGDVAAFPVGDALSQKLQWFGTLRGRIGPTITPTVLLYVTGGLAYGEVKTFEAVNGVNITGQNGTNNSTSTPVAAAFGSTSTRVGWTVGGGIEGAIGGNWTAKLEYLYMDLGTVSASFITPILTPAGSLLGIRYSSHITDNILRVGVNYRFGGPVVARY